MTEPQVRRTIDWRQAFGEALLLFLGVAVALAGQALWEHRTDRRTEDFYRANLGAELRENRESTLRTLAFRHSYRDGAVRLLEILGGAQPFQRADSLRFLANRLGATMTTRISQAALDDLIGSGNLGVITDTGLRLSLSRYAEAIERNQVVEARLMGAFWDQGLLPFLLSDRSTVLESAGRDREPDLPRSRFPGDYESLAASPEFENLVGMSIWLQRDAIITADALLAAISDVLASLE